MACGGYEGFSAICTKASAAAASLRREDVQTQFRAAAQTVSKPFLLLKNMGMGHNLCLHVAILVYFSGDWDVHWGYDLDFDPWPYGPLLTLYSMGKEGLWARRTRLELLQTLVAFEAPTASF